MKDKKTVIVIATFVLAALVVLLFPFNMKVDSIPGHIDRGDEVYSSLLPVYQYRRLHFFPEYPSEYWEFSILGYKCLSNGPEPFNIEDLDIPQYDPDDPKSKSGIYFLEEYVRTDAYDFDDDETRGKICSEILHRLSDKGYIAIEYEDKNVAEYMDLSMGGVQWIIGWSEHERVEHGGHKHHMELKEEFKARKAKEQAK